MPKRKFSLHVYHQRSSLLASLPADRSQLYVCSLVHATNASRFCGCKWDSGHWLIISVHADQLISQQLCMHQWGFAMMTQGKSWMLKTSNISLREPFLTTIVVIDIVSAGKMTTKSAFFMGRSCGCSVSKISNAFYLVKKCVPFDFSVLWIRAETKEVANQPPKRVPLPPRPSERKYYGSDSSKYSEDSLHEVCVEKLHPNA